MLRMTLAGAVIAVATSGALATMYSAQLPTNEYGHQDQNGMGVNLGNVACGPTAVVNSFTFLINHYQGLGNLIDTNAVTTINDLEGAGYMNTSSPNGTTIQNLISGKSQWIHDRGLDDKIAIEGQTYFTTGDTRIEDNTKPTLSFIYDQINKGQDVEILFSWWNGTAYDGGHYVTVTGISYDDQVPDSGNMNIIDPWGGGEFSASLTTHNGFIQLAYNGGAATDPNDPDNPDHVGLGDITSVVAESPIPAPGALFSFTLLGLAGARRRRR